MIGVRRISQAGLAKLHFNFSSLGNRQVSGPKSLRAIAQACAENPIALAIPCHRVMGNSGSMAGYRWGIERKQALINREVAARFRCPLTTGRASAGEFRFTDNNRSSTIIIQIYLENIR